MKRALILSGGVLLTILSGVVGYVCLDPAVIDKVMSYFELRSNPHQVNVITSTVWQEENNVCGATIPLTRGERWRLRYYWYEKDAMCLGVENDQGTRGVILNDRNVEIKPRIYPH